MHHNQFTQNTDDHGTSYRAICWPRTEIANTNFLGGIYLQTELNQTSNRYTIEIEESEKSFSVVIKIVERMFKHFAHDITKFSPHESRANAGEGPYNRSTITRIVIFFCFSTLSLRSEHFSSVFRLPTHFTVGKRVNMLRDKEDEEILSLPHIYLVWKKRWYTKRANTRFLKFYGLKNLFGN